MHVIIKKKSPPLKKSEESFTRSNEIFFNYICICMIVIARKIDLTNLFAVAFNLIVF